jgi:kynurenine formamidase
MVFEEISPKLLIPGWAGEVTDAEAKYIAEQLTRSTKLRQNWGVRQYFGRRRKKISPNMAKRLCQAWATNPAWGVKGLSTASPEKETAHGDTFHQGLLTETPL